ncbi:hypothetical protein KH5_01200 [Urechidicola sp. KH5]
MNLLKKIFRSSENEAPKEPIEVPVVLELDDLFVHHFIKKGGKFLYCTSEVDVAQNIANIIEENDWDKLSYKSKTTLRFLSTVEAQLTPGCNASVPFVTTCESLIAEDGSILFSSNQLGDAKLCHMNNNFIVIATTSQMVKSRGDSLTAINLNYKGNIPTNISAVQKYKNVEEEDNFLNYGTNNSKNLYLLLLENL